MPGPDYPGPVRIDSYAPLLPVPRLRTERLLLREYLPEDLAPMVAMSGDPEGMRYIGEGATLDEPATWRALATGIGHWQLRGYGFWAVCDAASGEMIGRCGLVNPLGWPGLELGWQLVRKHWGRGYATEAARASQEYAWEVLEVDRLISVIRRDNTRSAAVAARLGAHRDSVIELLGQPADVWVHTPPARPG